MLSDMERFVNFNKSSIFKHFSELKDRLTVDQ
jgi:hypothetical protein